MSDHDVFVHDAGLTSEMREGTMDDLVSRWRMCARWRAVGAVEDHEACSTVEFRAGRCWTTLNKIRN